jgi:hypothetical protein
MQTPARGSAPYQEWIPRGPPPPPLCAGAPAGLLLPSFRLKFRRRRRRPVNQRRCRQRPGCRHRRMRELVVRQGQPRLLPSRSRHRAGKSLRHRDPRRERRHPEDPHRLCRERSGAEADGGVLDSPNPTPQEAARTFVRGHTVRRRTRRQARASRRASRSRARTNGASWGAAPAFAHHWDSDVPPAEEAATEEERPMFVRARRATRDTPFAWRFSRRFGRPGFWREVSSEHCARQN